MKSTLDAKRSKEIQKVITPTILGLILDELRAMRDEQNKSACATVEELKEIRGLLEQQQASNLNVASRTKSS